MTPLKSILDEVYLERARQDAKWGEQNHPNGTGGEWAQEEADSCRQLCDVAFQDGCGTFRLILAEEVAEAFAESDKTRLREELIQVAAVAVAWVEKLDRERP